MGCPAAVGSDFDLIVAGALLFLFGILLDPVVMRSSFSEALPHCHMELTLYALRSWKVLLISAVSSL